ncbi:hypothetical protein BWQ96_06281 [Gracilariopsis chorda]|uniref:Uncharacterized protein n=1 Tax=Gracilariopsis chorda TaxID=448386 RepID=A0A2V3IPF6_9FLOR|nr:hypothetical protein BWQ96_06281 [Gracilariopsis chorda]|eukprot:PXF43971.1 hypothetical protein BWQ96_06281 [Gracilariopsis chorda]
MRLGRIRDLVIRSNRVLSLTPKYKPLYIVDFFGEKFLVLADLDAIHEVCMTRSLPKR